MRSLPQYLVLLVITAFFSHAAQPNVVIINVDDLGWSEVEYLPNKVSIYKSPNIRKLADSGMAFSQSYAACPVCSPTRASLVTGRSPAALRLTKHIAGNPAMDGKRGGATATHIQADAQDQLPLEEITFAEVLKAGGYNTAFIGKWHLAGTGSVVQRHKKGAVAPQFHPDKQGFDLSIGGNAYGQPPSWLSPYKNAQIKDGPKGEYLPQRLAQEATNFIAKNHNSPFLLYLNPYAVHTPIRTTDAYKKKYQKMGGKGNPVYGGMILAVDDMVGAVVEKLDTLKLRENTMIVFTSDNGGLKSSKDLRGAKGELFEGGIRIPTIISWPGHVKAGSLSDAPIISYDLFPTVLAAAGLADKTPATVEGENLLPHLLGDALKRETPVFWHYPHYHHKRGDMGAAIRMDDWKLILNYRDDSLNLFNLDKDPKETTDLAKKMPEKAAEMHKRLMAILADVDAAMPTKR